MKIRRRRRRGTIERILRIVYISLLSLSFYMFENNDRLVFTFLFLVYDIEETTVLIHPSVNDIDIYFEIDFCPDEEFIYFALTFFIVVD